MINIRTVVLYVLLLALPAAMMAAPQYVPNVVLVQFQVGTETTALQNVASALDLADTARIGKTNIYRLRSHSQDAPAMVVALKARPDVLIVEPDYIGHLASTPNDTYWSDAGLWNLRQVAAQSAWDVTRGTASFVVAVIDSGARYTHQDLSGNMWNNPGGIGSCQAWTHGYNFVSSTCDPMDTDNAALGHGTGVAGIIGAMGNNALGLVGINWTTSIMALKVVNNHPDAVLNSNVIAAN